MPVAFQVATTPLTDPSIGHNGYEGLNPRKGIVNSHVFNIGTG